MKLLHFSLSILLCTPLLQAQSTPASHPLRIGLVGLVHGHTASLLKVLPTRPDAILVGIAEPDPALREKYKQLFHLRDNLFFASEADLLAHTDPEVILIYTSPHAHRAAVELAASRHIASVVEKPFSTTLEDALAMQQASIRYNVPVLVNYSTTWFPSNIAAAGILTDNKIGPLRKIVVHDGHRGPKETGVSPEFFNWLTDPIENGAGALFDFGCYGVDVTTWLMHGELPQTVTAITLHIRPDIYPKVDDDSTILLTYSHTQAIIQGSWNWPYDRKDLELYGSTGYVDTIGREGLRIRPTTEKTEHTQTAPAIPAPQDDLLHYLEAILHDHQPLTPDDLSGIDTNVTVMRILSAARESAATGRTIFLTKQP